MESRRPRPSGYQSYLWDIIVSINYRIYLIKREKISQFNKSLCFTTKERCREKIREKELPNTFRGKDCDQLVGAVEF